MEDSGSSWRPPSQADPATNVPGAVGADNDWRAHLPPEARQRIVSKIMDTLKRHLPISAPEGLGELNKIAVRFEEKIYAAATCQVDYLRKISMKMLTMEQKNPAVGGSNTGPPSSNIANQNSPDAVNVMSSQLRHQIPSIGMPMPGQQVSTSMQPSLTMTGSNQSTITNIGQSLNIQTMPGISQASLNNPAGQGVAPNLYVNTQRQLVGRQLQHPIVPQQQQQQTNQLVYQQQIMKKMSHPSLLQTQMSQQQKSQSMLQASLPSSQQPMMQVASGLQPNQAYLQNQQSSVLQSVSQNPAQPSTLSIYQPSQNRQQQTSQQASLQQQASMLQQSSSLSQQQLLSHPSNVSSMQHLQFGQQNNISDVQHQQHSRLSNQQNRLLNLQPSQQALNQQNISIHQQQQLGTQSNASGLQQHLSQSQQQQQQPAQLLGQHQNQLNSQSTTSSIQQHPQSPLMLQHQKTAGQVPQASSALLQMQGSQTSQQQHMAQLQPQSLQLQQQLAMQAQQTNTFQREMLQRHPASAALLQPQNVIEQQKQPLQTQKLPAEAPSTSVDSTAQTTHAGIDVVEEIYQKIKSWKDMYYTDLQETYQRLTSKLQQHEGLVLPPGKQSDQLENLRKFKMTIERLIQIFQLPKSSIPPVLKDKLPIYEKQIIALVSSSRKRPPQGQQFQTASVVNQSMQQQSDTMIGSVQQMNALTSATTVQSTTAVSSLQSGSMHSAAQAGAQSTQQNIMNTLQPCSNMDSSQGNSLSSLQQGAMGSLQQSNLGTMHQASINTQQSSSLNALMQNANTLQSPFNTLQQNSNVFQHQLINNDQKQQLMQAQQINQQFHQRQLQQQMIQQQQMIHQQNQHILQQQLQLQQQILQPKQVQHHALQAQHHPMQQLHQMNEMNELKLKHPGMKSGIFPSHNPSVQRQSYYQQQMKPLGSPFSPQNLQAQSPLMSQHLSPQVDQQPVSSLTKITTPLQSTTPPFAVPSPSTPLAPSPLPGEHEKQASGISSLSNAGNVGQQCVAGQAQVQSLALGTPGISTSPLLAELDGFQPNLPTAIPGRSSSVEQPLERLLKAVESSSSFALRSAISDIASVVSMIDRIAGAAPGNGSRAAVGEDLVAITKCRLQARNFMSLDGSTTRKMKRQISVMPLIAVPSFGSANENLTQSATIDTFELESTATSNSKMPRLEVSNTLLDEIRDINNQLIDTVVDVAGDDMDFVAEGGEGTVVKCTFCAVALSPNLKSHLESTDVSPILPIRFFIPTKYPSCSPILLDKVPADLSSGVESGDLSAKARARFAVSLRGLPQKMSLKDMAKTWDVSARAVILEYAQQNGGGNFTSRYGAWENCVGA